MSCRPLGWLAILVTCVGCAGQFEMKPGQEGTTGQVAVQGPPESNAGLTVADVNAACAKLGGNKRKDYLVKLHENGHRGLLFAVMRSTDSEYEVRNASACVVGERTPTKELISLCQQPDTGFQEWQI